MSLGSVLNQAGAGSYTRNQILSDATKIAYGLTEAATPDDVFNLLHPRNSGSRVLAGVYIGDGTLSRTILPDAALSAVIVWDLGGRIPFQSNANTYYYNGMATKERALRGERSNEIILSIGDKGFIVVQNRFPGVDVGTADYVELNTLNQYFGYIAVVAS